jgi:glycosyltransferase involved in cell wall biosynthesis
MKIGLLSFEYPPETGFGGIGTYTWYHARALAKLGHEVHVLAGALRSGPHRPVEQDGVTVHRFRSSGPVMTAFGALAKLGWWWTKNRLETAFSMYRGLRVLLRRHHFDIIEMPECGGEGAFVNHLLGARTVVRFHSPARLIMPYYDVRAGDVRWCGRIEQIGIRGATAFSSCSRFLAGEVSRHLGVARPVRVIANGIDLALFDREEQIDFRGQFDLPRDRVVIFFSGRMERRKGIELCTEIAASVLQRFPVAFVLAGEDLFNYVATTLLPSVRDQQLLGSIHYLGKLDLAAVRSGLRQSDIFLLPSLWENCPYSCLEAMAAGRAIVCSDQGGMPELIRDGVNGLLARSGDAGSYVQALETLIADATLRERLGREARATVASAHRDVVIAQQAVDFYRNGPEAQDSAAGSIPELAK